MTGPLSPPPLPDPILLENPADFAADGSLPAEFARELSSAGVPAFVANADPTVMVLRQGRLAAPLLVEDGSIGRSYVSSPHSTYVLYARDEMDIVELDRFNRFGGHMAIGVLDRLLRSIRLNKAVHLDNYLLSTNLHGGWRGEGLTDIRTVLAERFPDSFLILRSLDPWSCPELLEAARSDGWALLPARQVWVTNDLDANWRPRNHVSSDRRKLKKSGLTVEHPEELSGQDASRIAELYRQLYLGRYSAINPDYTPRFVEASARVGLLRYRLARNADGQIMAFTAMRIAGGIVTTPLIGYDMHRPQNDGLYRIASYLSSQYAHEQGLRHHGSSGAGTFKSNRGACGVIEYTAVFGRHLSRGRRAGLGVLESGLERMMVPMLKSQGW